MAEIKFEIKEKMGTLSSNDGKGWTKELNLVSWNEGVPKFDIRSWSGDHLKMSKGITLSKEELSELKNILAGMEL